MRTSSLRIAAALIMMWTGVAISGTTDIAVVRTDVVRADGGSCTASLPRVGNPVCVTVVVKNLGPDAYDGSGGGSLGVSVDIDEPTKPGLDPRIEGCRLAASFTGTIAAGDSAAIAFGVQGDCAPSTSGPNHARATATAQGSNSDPVTGNNQVTTVFHVEAGVPAAGLLGLAGLGLTIAWVVWRSRRYALARGR